MSDEQELKIDRCEYTCDYCYRPFHTEKGLDRHTKKHHRDAE